MLKEAVVTDKQREEIYEAARRMLAGEEGMHTKTVGDVKLIRKTTLPTTLKANLKADLYYKRLVFVGSLSENGHEVTIYERRYGK